MVCVRSVACWVMTDPFTGKEATEQTMGQSLDKKVMGFKKKRQDAVLHPCLLKYLNWF